MKSELKAVEYMTSDEIIKSLNELENTQGWKIVKEFAEENIKRLEQNIKDIEKDLVEGEITDPIKTMQLREKRKFQQELIKTNLVNIPSIIIKGITDVKNQEPNKPPINPDPYDQSPTLTN